MKIKYAVWVLVIAFIIGGIGGVLFNRFLIPFMSSLPGLSWMQKLESSNPVIINRREEVSYNEGTNLINLSKQAAAYTVSIYSAQQKFLTNGIIVSADGMVLSSKANLPATGGVTIITNDGSNYPGAIRALDPRSDLAVITFNGSNLPFAQFSDSWNLQTSQRLIYIGRGNKEFQRQFGSGAVTQNASNQASLERVFSSENFENTVLTDAKLTSDFIGGPILNLNGEVVGMTQSSLQVLPSEALATAVQSFFSGGKIARPVLGVKYLYLSAALAKLKSLPQAGLLVQSVDAGSPAAKAGLVANDLIINFDNQAVPDSNFEKILNQHAITQVPIEVLRNGEQLTLTATLEAK